MVDTISTQRRSAVMARIRSKDTSSELVVRRLIFRLGYRYRLHVADLPGKPDLVFPTLRKIIEVRGCFWHQHIGCADSHLPKSRTDYWVPKLNRNVERDKANEKELMKLGWRVLTVWDCELKSIRTVTKRLVTFLKH
jgi:DNA mismatch endonuclease (patch repair protein)